MKFILATLTLFGLATSTLDKTSSFQALKTLEQKLITSVTGKLDNVGTKQLKNLLQVISFSHFTDLASKTPQQLRSYENQLYLFQKPQINQRVYNAQITKVEQQIKKQSENKQQSLIKTQ